MSLKSTTMIGTNTYEIIAQASAERFEKALDAAYNRNKKRINVPGFRKGKASRKMIEKLYGETFFYEEAANRMVESVCYKAINDSELEVVGQPKIEATDISKENGITFKITVTTKPEIEIADYKGLEVENPEVTVSDEDVEKSLKNMQERNGRLVTVEGRAVESGDTVDIDYTGYIDGKAFEGGAEEGYSLKIGSGAFIPGFEDQIIGHSAGEEFTINVTFPENYQMDEIAGKAAEFKIVLNEIQSLDLPELDDDFAKDTSEFDTLDELKADIKAKLEENAKKTTENNLDIIVQNEIAKKVVGEIPECMITEKIDRYVEEYEHRLSHQGLTLDLYLSFLGQTMEQFREQFKAQAEVTTRARLAFEKIAKLENMDASQEEIDAEMQKIAESNEVEIDVVKASIPESGIKEDILIRKAFDFVKENVVIKA